MTGIYPGYNIIIGAGIILLIITSIYLYKRYLKKKNRKNLTLAIISILFVILAIIFEAFLILDYVNRLNHHILEYSVELNSTSEGYEIVYVPISSDRNLQNLIEITSGNGEINIIESEYGICLEINFTDFIEVNAILDTREGIGNHDLTMVNQTIPNLDPTEPEVWEWIEYWIYYEPNNPNDHNCSVSFELIHNTYDWWEIHNFEGLLDGDWNTYRARHEAIS